MMRPIIFMMLLCVIVPPVFAANIEARLNWSQRLIMSTTVSGVVDEVMFKAGDRVNKGDVLVRLQPDRFKAALASALATRNDAKYKLEEAQREWERAQELYDRTVLSDRDLQLAENALIQARAVLARAKLQHTNAKRDLIESEIRAPFDAVVLSYHAVPGQVVITRMRAVPLVSIAARGRYIADGHVSLRVANTLKKGQVVSVSVNDKSYKGVIDWVGFETENNKNTYPVRVLFEDYENLLRTGQSAIIHLP